MMSDTDLFGNVVTEPRRRRPRFGYAWPPGSGPAGETCRTCRHACRLRFGMRAVYKCGAVRERWTASIRTDIRLDSPSCRGWEPRG